MSQFRLYALIKEIKRDVLCILGCISVVSGWLCSPYSGQGRRDLAVTEGTCIFSISDVKKQNSHGLVYVHVPCDSCPVRLDRGEEVISLMAQCWQNVLKHSHTAMKNMFWEHFANFSMRLWKKLYFWTFKISISWSYERSSPFDHFANIIKTFHLKSKDFINRHLRRYIYVRLF